MPTSCREQIVSAVLTRLGTIVVTGLTVERDRPIPLRAEECPKLILREADETFETIFTGEDSFRLAVEVEGYAVGASALVADASLAELRAESDRALQADITLGGLLRDLRIADEPKDPMLGFDGAPYGKAFVRTYELIYATVERDPYTFA